MLPEPLEAPNGAGRGKGWGMGVGLLLFFPLQVVGGDPAFAGNQAVLHLAVPPSVGVSLQHLQTGSLGETHCLLIATVIGNGHVHISAEVVVDQLALLQGLGSDRRHGDAVALVNSAQGILDIACAERAPRRPQTRAFSGPRLAFNNYVWPHGAE